MRNAALIEQRITTTSPDIAMCRTRVTNGLAELAHDRYRELVRSNRNLLRNAAVSEGQSYAIREVRMPTIRERIVGSCLIAPFFWVGSLCVILLLPEKFIKSLSKPLSGASFWMQFGKRAFDFIMALLGFAFCSILYMVVPIVIRLDTPGTTFYQQVRVGKNHRRRDRRQIAIQVGQDRRKGERRQNDLCGRPFRVYKFRTMRQDAEKFSGAVWAQKDDPRITRVGAILRFTHIDEIPQFLNVLQGDMSMVGPRPERPQIIPNLTKEIPEYKKRLEVKPGMTGIAQIYCGYDETIDDVREKVRYDLLYSNRHSLKSDILILFQTLWMIIRGREAADE